MQLEEIAIKHKTQKVPHGYMPIYEKFFSEMKDKSITLVEIGVAEGASMKTWTEYFTNGKILGLEAASTWRPGPELPNVALYVCDTKNEERFSDCCEMIKEYYESPDIIIDDASHIAGEQLAAFKKLWPLLRPGGWYVIEDLFTLYDEVWNPSPDPLHKIPNIVDMIQSRMKKILIGGDEIQEVHWFGRNNINGIVFLRKRYEPFRIQPLEEFKM